jgi:hypothetical protein
MAFYAANSAACKELIPVTVPARILEDVQVKDLLSACGFSERDLSVYKMLFRKFADLESPALNAAKRMSVAALKKFLIELGAHMPTESYAEQYFRAFDIDGSGDIDFREACLGLMVMDPGL